MEENPKLDKNLDSKISEIALYGYVLVTCSKLKNSYRENEENDGNEKRWLGFRLNHTSSAILGILVIINIINVKHVIVSRLAVEIKITALFSKIHFDLFLFLNSLFYPLIL